VGIPLKMLLLIYCLCDVHISLLHVTADSMCIICNKHTLHAL